MPHTIFNTSVLNTLLRMMSLILLRILGWRIDGNLPETRKFVLIAAPHTSNWDAFYMSMVALVFRVNLYWMGKNTLFRGPVGFVTRFLGGIPIDRSMASGVVAQSIRVLKEIPEMVLAVPPEGSRKKVSHWKSGFYHIAAGAGVPIVLGYLDYGRKHTGIGPAIQPTGDLQRDFEAIRQFYTPMQGKYPWKTSSTGSLHID
ncbi:lysophospholipid acyltransferase family protein [bacterium]|nr:lysophospholipid acyltransferase family protein [bacterium]